MYGPRTSRFETTRWSLVLAAGGSHATAARDALGILCETYWYPLYVYVRRQGNDPEQASDLVQSFVLTLLERDDLRHLHPDRGRFRAFLLASLRHFLSNQRVHDRAVKRGGRQMPIPLELDSAEQRYVLEPADTATPETIFERNWAITVFDAAFDRIRAEWEAKARGAEFDRLKDCLMGEIPPGGYQSLASALDSTEAAVKMAVHRLKRRFHQELRAEVAETVTGDSIDDELRYLLGALQT
jgi:RNA polymerase sigma-70 factor (ECF subfamily)